MWIMTNFGFFSIVCAHDNGTPHPTLRMIRARKRTHLRALRERCPQLSAIVETKDTDYPYRILTDKNTVTAILMNVAEEMDYSNFKGEVKEAMPNDEAYLHFLHTVWGAGLRMTEPQVRKGGFFGPHVYEPEAHPEDLEELDHMPEQRAYWNRKAKAFGKKY